MQKIGKSMLTVQLENTRNKEIVTNKINLKNLQGNLYKHRIYKRGTRNSKVTDANSREREKEWNKFKHRYQKILIERNEYK